MTGSEHNVGAIDEERWPLPPEIVAALSDEERSTLVEQRPDRWVGSTVIIDRADPSDDEQPAVGQRIHSLIEQLARASFPVGAVLAATEGWMVTARPSGYPADRPDLHADPDDLVVAVGAGLQRFHSIPIASVPAAAENASGWGSVAEACRRAVTAPGFDASALPAPYDRYDGPALLSMMVDGRPAAEEPVCCHGQPSLAQFIVDRAAFTGFGDLSGVVVADRHLDLAVTHQSVHHELGPEAVFRFYESYGEDPDLVRLDHYVLVAHLLGTSPTPATGATATPAERPPSSTASPSEL